MSLLQVNAISHGTARLFGKSRETGISKGRSLEEELTGRHAAKLLGIPILLGWSLRCAIVSFSCLCATSFIQYHLPYSSYPDSVDLIKCGMFWSLSWIMSQFLAIKDLQNRIIIGGPDGPRPARRRWRLLGRSRVGAQPHGGGNGIHWIIGIMERSQPDSKERRCPTRKESTLSRGERKLKSWTK